MSLLCSGQWKEGASIDMEGNVDLQHNVEAKQRKADFRQRVEERFSWAFGDVFQKDKPRIHVEPFFSFHETAKDSELLNEQIRQADIFIPEAFGWRPKDLALLRESSSGERRLEEIKKGLRRRPPFFVKTLEAVYNSHKAIVIIDVPSANRLKRESSELWTYNPSYEGEFADVLSYTRTFLNALSLHQDKREDYVLKQITPQKIEELLNIYSALRSQKSIEILISLGLSHSLIPPDYPESTFMDQGIITQRLGREIDDELVAKIFLERFLDTLFRVRVTQDSRKLSFLKRIIIGQLNYKDAQRIFNYCKDRKIFPRNEFYRIFDEKEIKIPNTEKELDELVLNSSRVLP